MSENGHKIVDMRAQADLQEFKLIIFQEVAHSFGFYDTNSDNLDKIAKKLAISMAELHYNDKPAYDDYIKAMDEKIPLSNIGLDVHYIIIAFAQPESPLLKKVDNALRVIFGGGENHSYAEQPVIIQDEETGIYRPSYNNTKH